MIAGIGVDIAECDRIERAAARFGDAFLRRLYPDGEIPRPPARAAETYAGVFAAKEAFAKALGCGFGGKCRWEEIRILHDAAGRPFIETDGATRATLAGIADKVHLSISHEKNSAVAMVVLEKDGR
ncbi:MAG: holo-ACP synthase [Victivallaceae bacterium]|nr:holo-ACP synthase [Victivallaceae bacterium]